MWVSYALGPVFSYKLRYIVGFWLVEMAMLRSNRNIVEGETFLTNQNKSQIIVVQSATPFRFDFL